MARLHVPDHLSVRDEEVQRDVTDKVRVDDGLDDEGRALRRGVEAHAVGPALFILTNYESTGRGVIFRPVCLPTLLSFKYFEKMPQCFLKNLQISGDTLTSGIYPGFPAIPAKSCEHFGEKYAIWIGFKRQLHKILKNQ